MLAECYGITASARDRSPDVREEKSWNHKSWDLRPGVCTLVLYPAHSSHRALSAEERKRVGIGDGVVRMSVRIETGDDILADVAQALQALG